MIAILILLLLLVIWIVLYTYFYGISPMPSSGKAKNQLLSIIPREFNGSIIELGSGWGTLAFPVARLYPNHTVIAYEISPVPWMFSKIRQLIEPRKNLEILRKNFFNVPLSGAGLIICYLYPGAMRQLKTKFVQELSPGTWIVSNTFAIPEWKPEAIFEISDLYKTKIYLYKV